MIFDHPLESFVILQDRVRIGLSCTYWWHSKTFTNTWLIRKETHMMMRWSNLCFETWNCQTELNNFVLLSARVAAFQPSDPDRNQMTCSLFHRHFGCYMWRCCWSPKSIWLHLLHSALLQLFWAAGRHDVEFFGEETCGVSLWSSWVKRLNQLERQTRLVQSWRPAPYGTLTVIVLIVREHQNSTMLGPWEHLRVVNVSGKCQDVFAALLALWICQLGGVALDLCESLRVSSYLVRFWPTSFQRHRPTCGGLGLDCKLYRIDRESISNLPAVSTYFFKANGNIVKLLLFWMPFSSWISVTALSHSYPDWKFLHSDNP